MYSFKFEGKKVELPDYTVDLLQELDELDNGTYDSKYDQLRAMYDFSKKLIGEQMDELIGDFASADPNLINILFLSILREYNRPLTEFSIKDSVKELESPEIKDAINTIGKVVEMKK